MCAFLEQKSRSLDRSRRFFFHPTWSLPHLAHWKWPLPHMTHIFRSFWPKKNTFHPSIASNRAVQALGAQLVVCKGTQELWDDEIRLGTVIPFPRNRGGCRGFIYTCLGPFIYGVINFGMRVLGVVLWDLNTFSKYISSTRIGTSASKAKKTHARNYLWSSTASDCVGKSTVETMFFTLFTIFHSRSYGKI